MNPVGDDMHAADESSVALVAALLVATARRVRDHLPNTAAQCLLMALRLLPAEAMQDRVELQLELAHLVTMSTN